MWSPDGESIATASFDGSSYIFDAHTGRQRFALRGNSAAVLSVDWSPDSTRLVTGRSDGTARVWQLTGSGGRVVASLSAHGMSRSDIPTRTFGSTPANRAKTLLHPRYAELMSFQKTAFAIESMRICSIC